MSGVRERLSQLQRDLAVLKRATLQPLVKRHLGIARDCERIDSTLLRYQTDLERLRATFDTLWQDQLRRIRLEQEIFQSQVKIYLKFFLFGVNKFCADRFYAFLHFNCHHLVWSDLYCYIVSLTEID